MVGPGGFTRSLRSIAIDFRWVHRAFINAPNGAIAGVGSFARSLWLGLSSLKSHLLFTVLVENGAITPPFADLLTIGPMAEIRPVGLSGLAPFLDRHGRYIRFVRSIEERSGVGMRLSDIDVLHMIDHNHAPRAYHGAVVSSIHEAPLRDDPPLLVTPASHSEHTVTAFAFNSAAVQAAYPSLRNSLARVIHCGVDCRVFNTERSPLDSEVLDRTKRRPYFLHAGLLFKRKNPEGVLRALQRISDSLKDDISLVSVGPYQVNPIALEQLRRLAGTLSLDDRLIVISEGASPALMAAYYRNSIGLVFPSLFEGFGYPALESLACGTPCVVSRVGGLPEVVGPLGLLVKPTDHEDIASAMLKMLKDSRHREYVKRAGPARARQFAPEMMARAYLELYQQAFQARAAESENRLVQAEYRGS